MAQNLKSVSPEHLSKYFELLLHLLYSIFCCLALALGHFLGQISKSIKHFFKVI